MTPRAAVAVLVCAPVVWAAACRGTPDAAPAATAGPPRFPHAAAAHKALACGACHQQTPPGAADHAPCDGCHRDAFERTPGRFCDVCHERVEVGGQSPVVFPPRAGGRALAAEFSHELHLDARRMEDKIGHHVACRDCHAAIDGERDMRLPSHPACASCHERSDVAPAMTACAGCHVARDDDPRRERRLVRDDLHFRHNLHESDAAGAPILCGTCHTNIRRAQETGGVTVPPLEVCVGCHDDRARAPARVAMARCEACHSRPPEGFARLVAPRSHLGRAGRPDDHTLAFRRDHGVAAERDPARCASCHAGLSGGRSACDDCHQIWRPADHGVTWRELDHGSEAGTSATRCALCHGGEYCAACHSARPRSHAPADFARQGHAMAARANLRSCFTCHRIEVECAACHAGAFVR